MMVHFKDYGFFVPKDCSGKKLVMEGIAFIDVTPVSQLKHYAEDAGKSKEEIEKITEDEKELTFEASGVLLYNE
jgi:tRNA (Thr-GGU) A37 N-methylase